MTLPEFEKSLRFVLNEAMKSNIHPITITGTMDLIKLDIQMSMMEQMSQPPTISPATPKIIQPGG